MIELPKEFRPLPTGDPYRRLLAGIAAQAVRDIEAAAKFQLKRLLAAHERVWKGRPSKLDEFIVERWRSLEVHHALEFFKSPLWHNLADVLDLSPYTSSPLFLHKLDLVENKLRRLEELRRKVLAAKGKISEAEAVG